MRLGTPPYGSSVLSSQSYRPGVWQHIAMVWDAGTGQAHVYIDGAIDSTHVLQGAVDWANFIEFCIGNKQDDSTHVNFSGCIDDLRIYNRPLSASEIAQLAQTSSHEHTLVVESAYGTPAPPAGTHEFAYGSTVNASVDDSVSIATNARAVCTGWEGTGSVPASGTTNALSFAITNNSSITWQWRTEYRLDLTAGLGGTATGGGWYEAGTDVGIGAVSGEGYAFSHWSDGDTNAQRTVSMPAGGLALSAHFAPLAGESIEQVVFNLNGDVWMMNTDGTNLRQVTHVGGIVGSTRLSDNGVLVYCAAAQLWVADADGTDARTIPNITNPAYDFALSPDGSQVAFGEGPSTHFSTYTIRVDGTGRRTVRSTGNYHQMPHGWGMDGFIYFVECIYGNPYTQHVLRIPQEGGTPTSLVGYFSQTPAVSAQGGKVLFLYNQPAPKLRVMNADGSGQTDVPNTPQGVGQSPAIGADGSKVFYVYNGNIWRVGADGTDPRQLTTVGGISSGLDIGFLLTQTPKVNLTVDSAHGSPSPAAGMSLHLYGSLVNAMVQSVVAVGSYERRACVGWTGSGSVPSAGISNQVSFALEESSSLTWLWETQYRVEVQADGNGSVTGSGWYPESYNVELRAIPTAGHRLVEWSDGDTNAVRTVVVSAGGAVFTARFEPIPAGGGLWLDCANLPVGRVAGWAACVPALGRIYVIGSHDGESDPVGSGTRNDRYDPATDTWTPMARYPRGEGRGGIQGAAAHGGDIYFFGGVIYCFGGSHYGGPFYANTYRFDPVSRSFAARAAMPQPRSGMSAFVWENKIWLCGGRGSSGRLDDIVIYDPASDAWSQGPAIPMAALGATFLTYAGFAGDGHLYFVFGDVPDSDPSCKPLVFRYEPNSDTWTPMAPAPHGDGDGGAVAIGNRIYSIGGDYYRHTGAFSAAVQCLELGTLADVKLEVVSAYGSPTPPAGTIRFKTSQYVGSEVLDDYGVVGLTVQRVDGSLGAASVSFSIVAGSATENVDYIPWAAGGELHWVDGDAAIKRIYIDIPDDLDYEGTEEFQVVLSNATGAVLGSPAVATVSILDNEPAPSRILKLVDELSFGNVVVGTTQTVALAVVNVGNATLNVGGIVLPAGFDVSASNFTVAPGCTQFVDVAFAPDAIGAFGGELSIQSDATAGVPVLPISGVGIAPTPEDPDSAVRSIVNLTASIDIKVPDEATFLAVEDALEPGLFVVAMSHGGTWDPINRKVKWFFTEPGQVYSRILTYTVNTSGRVAAGAVNFGTGDIAITGERVFDGEVSPALLHPADANANWSVSLEEAASLVGQWKLGVSEQPHNVVVRGITLYLQGEQYYWDSEEASPAKRWKSLLSGVLPAMASMPSANEGDLRVTAAVALPVEGAVRRISSGVVSVYVTPPGGTFAWGCEESVPSGVAVSGIGSAGVWDPVSHKIRWAFFDGQPRDLVYTVSGEPGQYTLSGRIGFDGSEEDVQGETSVIVPRPFAAWAAARGLSSDLQEAFSQTDPTTGVPNGWRYVFGDAFQPGAELLHITMVGGIPVVDMPAQDVTTLDDVDLRLEATTYLDASVWDLAVEPVSGGEAGRSYWMPLVVPYRAFFRFKATLK